MHPPELPSNFKNYTKFTLYNIRPVRLHLSVQTEINNNKRNPISNITPFSKILVTSPRTAAVENNKFWRKTVVWDPLGKGAAVFGK